MNISTKVFTITIFIMYLNRFIMPEPCLECWILWFLFCFYSDIITTLQHIIFILCFFRIHISFDMFYLCLFYGLIFTHIQLNLSLRIHFLNWCKYFHFHFLAVQSGQMFCFLYYFPAIVTSSQIKFWIYLQYIVHSLLSYEFQCSTVTVYIFTSPTENNIPEHINLRWSV